MINKEMFVQNAKNLLALLDKYPDYCPVMHSFARNSDGSQIWDIHRLEKEVSTLSCGTSFCLAGLQAMEEGYPKEFVDAIDDFDFVYFSASKITYCVNKYDPLEEREVQKHWDFLYSEDWPNDRDATIRRLEYIVETNGKLPEYWEEFGFNG